MKRVTTYHFIVLLLLSILAPGVEVAGASQNVTAIWARQKAKDQAETDQGNLTYSVGLSQEATDAFTMSEALRYIRTRDEGRDAEFIDPSLRFSLRNDLFLFDVLGSASERRDSTAADRSKQGWETTWASNWQQRLWPKVRLSYAEDYDRDGETIHLTDTKNIRENGSVDWDFELFRTYYSYNRTRDSDFVQVREGDTTNHFGRFETGGNFWQNRVRYGFSQQFSQNTSRIATAVDGSGTALIKRTIGQAKTTNDDTPNKSDDVVFTSTPALLDGILDVASGVRTNANLADQLLNIAFAVDFNVVHRIYLYTKDNETLSADFRFDLYTSANGVDWQRISTNVPFLYNSGERRFELTVSPGAVRWLKLVVTQAPPVSHVTEFTELAVYQQVSATGGTFVDSSKTTTAISDFNTGVKLSETTDLSYTLSQENGGYSSGVDYSRRSQTANLRWAPWQYLATSLEAGETRERNGTAAETMSRRYGANIITLPLPTVDMTLNLSRTDQFEDEGLKSMSYDTGLFTTAALYPDLNSSLDLTYRRRHYEDTDLTSRDYGSRLVFTARLIPNVTADLAGDYQQSNGKATPESFESTMNVNWRASDLLSVNAGLRKRWRDWQRESESMNTGIALAPTEQVRLNFNVEYLNAEGTSNRYTSYVSWEIGPFFTFQFDASYGQQSNTEDWRARGQFIARFSAN